MIQPYNGTRKGISLVEMVIAIVLFATLATISLKYTKVYLNTDLQAKKARVAALTDQASQLLQAFQIYRTEKGANPTSMDELNGTAGILTSIPDIIKEMSMLGWQYTVDLNTSGLPAFYLKIDLNGSTDTAAQQKSGKEYCALFNREFNTSTELNVSATSVFGAGTIGDVNSSKTYFNRNQFCYSLDANTTQIAIFIP